MKKRVVFSILLLSSCDIAFASVEKTKKESTDKKESKYVHLSGREIESLDGIPFALDGVAIRQIMLVRAKIKEIQEGELDKVTKKRNPGYIYQGKKYDLQQLIKFEEQLEKSPNQAKSKEIQQCLDIAKRDFLDTTLEFMQRIAWVKSLVVDLIKQSSEKRKLHKSLMFEWVDTPVGHEGELFNQKVKTIEAFDTFLTQVNNFLGDLIYSCPKAFEQYKKEYVKK